MKNLPKLTSIRSVRSVRFSIACAVAAGLAASTVSSHAQSVTGTIFNVPAGGGSFDYTITLQNTGSLNINSFWYGWTLSGNNLPSNPTSAGNSRGWANNLDGNSIQWVNSTGTALAPGQSATFTFVSTSPLSAITTSPSGESVAYVHGITFSQGLAGDSTGIFSPTVTVAPEPSSLCLLAAGLLVVPALAASRKLRQAKL